MFPCRREETERMCWELEGGAEEMNAGEPGQTHGLVGSRAGLFSNSKVTKGACAHSILDFGIRVLVGFIRVMLRSSG